MLAKRSLTAVSRDWSFCVGSLHLRPAHAEVHAARVLWAWLDSTQHSSETVCTQACLGLPHKTSSKPWGS